MNYIVKIDFQPEFEISSDELIRRITENRIPSTTLARRIDSDIWKPLNKYPEFLYLIPPPLPTMQNNEKQKAETLVSNKNKSQIPNYFLPVGRISGSIFFFRNIINIFALGLIAHITKTLPDSIQEVVFFIPALLYIYLGIVTSIKRLHDWNITGWLSPLVLIPVIPLLFWLIPGNKNSNRFGEKLNGVWRNLFTA
jgi:uncharacterized membrane protein YhaH (DUF805 family)